MPPETLFLATIPGATPATWAQRFASRERTVQLVNHDESAQFAHLAHDPAGAPVHPLPQLGYVRWRRDEDLDAVLRAAGVEPAHVHRVAVYQELPVVCVGKEHLLAAWDVDADGPVPLAEIDPDDALDPERFAPAPDPDANPLDPAALPGAGERMALEIAASGAGHVLLPMSVARVFGRKDVVVLPVACELDEVAGLSRADREAAAARAALADGRLEGGDEAEGDAGRRGEAPASWEAGDAGDSATGEARHPGWDVGLAWLKEADSELVQSFVGIARGRRGNSSR